MQELLGFIGLADRLHLAWISSAEAQKFVQVVTDFTEHIRALGPNPLKKYQVDRPADGPGRRNGPGAARPDRLPGPKSVAGKAKAAQPA